MAGKLLLSVGASALIAVAGGLIVPTQKTATAIFQELYPWKDKLDTTYTSTELSAPYENFSQGLIHIDKTNSVTLQMVDPDNPATEFQGQDDQAANYLDPEGQVYAGWEDHGSSHTSDYAWKIIAATGRCSAINTGVTYWGLGPVLTAIAALPAIEANDPVTIMTSGSEEGLAFMESTSNERNFFETSTSKPLRINVWAYLSTPRARPTTGLCKWLAEDIDLDGATPSPSTPDNGEAMLTLGSGGNDGQSGGLASGSHLVFINFRFGAHPAHYAVGGPRVQGRIVGGRTILPHPSRNITVGFLNCDFTGSDYTPFTSGASGARMAGEERAGLWRYDCSYWNNRGEHGEYSHMLETIDINVAWLGGTGGHTRKRDGFYTICAHGMMSSGPQGLLPAGEPTYTMRPYLTWFDFSGRSDDATFFNFLWLANNSDGTGNGTSMTITERGGRGPFSHYPFRDTGQTFALGPAAALGDTNADFRRALDFPTTPNQGGHPIGQSNCIIGKSSASAGTGATVLSVSKSGMYYRALHTSASGATIAETAQAYNFGVRVTPTGAGAAYYHRSLATWDETAQTWALEDAIPAGYEVLANAYVVFYPVGEDPDRLDWNEGLLYKFDAAGNIRDTYIPTKMQDGEGDLDLACGLYGMKACFWNQTAILAGAPSAAKATINLGLFHSIASGFTSHMPVPPVRDPSVVSPYDAYLGEYNGEPGVTIVQKSFADVGALATAGVPCGGVYADLVPMTALIVCADGYVIEGGQSFEYSSGGAYPTGGTLGDFDLSEAPVIDGSIYEWTSSGKRKIPAPSGGASIANQSAIGRSSSSLASEAAAGASAIEVNDAQASSIANYAVQLWCTSGLIGDRRLAPLCWVAPDFAGGTTIPLVDVNGDPVSLPRNSPAGYRVSFVEHVEPPLFMAVYPKGAADPTGPGGAWKNPAYMI